MKIEHTETRTLHDGSTCLGYSVGEKPYEWSFEVVINPDGTLDLDSDGDPEHSRQSAKVWQAWADFVERQNERGWL